MSTGDEYGTPVFGETEDSVVQKKLNLLAFQLIGGKYEEHQKCCPPFVSEVSGPYEAIDCEIDDLAYPIRVFDGLILSGDREVNASLEDLIDPHANLIRWIMANDRQIAMSILNSVWTYTLVMLGRYPKIVGDYFIDQSKGVLWCGHVFHETVRVKSIGLGSDPCAIGVELIQFHNLISGCQPLCEHLSTTEDPEFGVIVDKDLRAMAGPTELLSGL